MSRDIVHNVGMGSWGKHDGSIMHSCEGVSATHKVWVMGPGFILTICVMACLPNEILYARSLSLQTASAMPWPDMRDDSMHNGSEHTPSRLRVHITTIEIVQTQQL